MTHTALAFAWLPSRGSRNTTQLHHSLHLHKLQKPTTIQNHSFHVPYMHPLPISYKYLLQTTPIPSRSSTMARLTTIIALFAVALLVADAYAYRTTITTVEVDEDNQGRQQECRQMSAREELRSCEQYLRQQSRYVLQMRGIGNPWRREGGSFDECCRELKDVKEECRCDLLEEIAREEQRQARGQEGRQMLQKARDLPSMCGIGPQRCDF